MARSIEFLHTEEDIPEFVSFLYMNDCYIWHRNSTKCQNVLLQEQAVCALTSDLFSPFGTYYIGRSENRQLLLLDSCGRQAHPRNLGKRGRYAGRIVCSEQTDLAAISLFKLIKSYFCKCYHYQRYNGAAKMRCYFAPHYMRLDEEYASAPDVVGICAGYLRVICMPSHKEYISNLTANVFGKYPAITVVSTKWHSYWEDGELLELQVALQYRSDNFSFEMFKEAAYSLADYYPLSNLRDRATEMSAAAHHTINTLKTEKQINMSFVMEHPW